MSPQEALDQAVREAKRRFQYIPDAPGADRDIWETPKEVEQKGGADCDGLGVWAVARAMQLAPSDQYWWVRGTVNGMGHAWAELRNPDGTRLWADPTWGLTTERPGWYSNRVPLKAYRWMGDIFSLPTDYVPVE